MASYLQSLLQSAHQTAFRAVLRFVEAELVPDFIVRRGIRYLLSIRLRESHLPAETLQRNKQAFVDELRGMPIALHTETANEQHYELPTEYFCQVLGRWRKYSSCLYRSATDTLDQAEENMLQLYCDELRLADGHIVLDLGCGWGSFTLYAAEQYPKCKFTAVSNSRTQKQFIDGQAAAAGLKNVTVITADMNDFDAPGEFDRVISVEMFEHMKNYGKLLSKVASWMKPGAIFFCHTFCHKTIAYHFEDNGDDDWMTRHFFTGGTMPSLDLFLYFQQHLKVAKVAYVNGMHYSRCLEAWLALQDQHRAELAPVFKDTYGKEASKWFVYWRLFYLACSELFKYNGGEEWGLAHYTFEKPAADATPGAS